MIPVSLLNLLVSEGSFRNFSNCLGFSIFNISAGLLPCELPLAINFNISLVKPFPAVKPPPNHKPILPPSAFPLVFLGSKDSSITFSSKFL